jgi:hypothetical protein
MESTLRYLSSIPPGPCWWEGKEEPEHDWHQSYVLGIWSSYWCRRCKWHVFKDGSTIVLPEKANKDWKPKESSMATFIEYYSGKEYLCVVVEETYQEVENIIRKLSSDDDFILVHTLEKQPFALKYKRINSFSSIGINEQSEICLLNRRMNLRRGKSPKKEE